MNNYKDIEWIENFRSGMLNEQEVLAFNERLNSDSSFKELYEDFFESEKLLQLKELWAVKEELNKFDYSIGEDSEDSTGKWWWGLSIVALIGAGSIYFMTAKDTPSVAPEVIQTVRESEVTTTSHSEPVTEMVSSENKPVLKASVSQERGTTTEANFQDTITYYDVKIAEEHAQPAEKISPIHEHKCDETPKVDIVTKGSCADESNGVVTIKSIKGNYAPYRMMTDTAAGSKQNKTEFRGLKAGRHLFYLVDSRECRTSLPVTIEKIECVKEELVTHKPVQNYLIYLPGQLWKAPMAGKRGKLEILDQKGNVILNKEVLKDESDEWAGLDVHSREVEPGVYFYVLKEEGIKDKTGTITVFK